MRRISYDVKCSMFFERGSYAEYCQKVLEQKTGSGRRTGDGRRCRRGARSDAGRQAAAGQGLEARNGRHRRAATLGHGVVAGWPHAGHGQAGHAAPVKRQELPGNSSRRFAEPVCQRPGRPARHRGPSRRQNQPAHLHDDVQRQRRREPDRAGAGRVRRQARDRHQATVRGQPRQERRPALRLAHPVPAR